MSTGTSVTWPGDSPVALHALCCASCSGCWLHIERAVPLAGAMQHPPRPCMHACALPLTPAEQRACAAGLAHVVHIEVVLQGMVPARVMVEPVCKMASKRAAACCAQDSARTS